MTDGEIGQHRRDGLEPCEVVGAVGVGDVGLASEDVDHRRMDAVEHVLACLDPGDAARAVVKDPAVVHQHRLHARVGGDFDRLQAAARMTGHGDGLCRHLAAQLAVVPCVFGDRPVDSGADVFGGRRRGRQSARRSRGLRRARLGRARAAAPAAGGNHQVAVRGDFGEGAAGGPFRRRRRPRCPRRPSAACPPRTALGRRGGRSRDAGRRGRFRLRQDRVRPPGVSGTLSSSSCALRNASASARGCWALAAPVNATVIEPSRESRMHRPIRVPLIPFPLIVLCDPEIGGSWRYLLAVNLLQYSP